ncbi:hypothetical protein [Roseomonas xinghualingensis]|uniref:hypothetical protein n=1 Tax=Roseomonas xinghualingensis TaxID=2986475 RepID=UPI0021F1EB38|nr:hypothetical protein [Roseomonas sp. SXEYE001]MCV4209019.1 hypothetical protein [Roseomonas sp. SXEYE001]
MACRLLRRRNLLQAPHVAGPENNNGDTAMRGILLWLIGIPIPIIILLYLFGVM